MKKSVASRCFSACSSRGSSVFIFAVFTAGLLWAGPVSSEQLIAPHGDRNAGLALVRSNAAGVVARYETGSVRLSGNRSGPVRVELAGADYPALPGEHDLPVRRIRVGLPQSGDFRVTINPGPKQLFDNIEPTVAKAVSRQEFDSQVASGALNTVVEYSLPAYIRDVRFVELTLHPCGYDPETRRLEVYEWLEVRVDFTTRPEEIVRPDPFDGIVTEMLINGSQAVNWKRLEPESRRSFFDRSSNWIKLGISECGIYAVSGRELAAAGLSLGSIDPGSLAMYTLGDGPINGPYPDTMIPVALHFVGEDTAYFGPDDKVIFYARAAEHWANLCSVWVSNSYTGQSGYWLTWGGEPGLRMKSHPGPTGTDLPIADNAPWRVRQQERNECPARSGLLWIWRTILKDSFRPMAGFDVPMAVKTPIRLKRVSGRLYSTTESNRVVVLLNGAPLDTLEFGITMPDMPFEFGIDATEPLMSRDNMLRFELHGDGMRKVMLHHLEYDIIRRLSLSDGQVSFARSDSGAVRFRIRDATGPVIAMDVTDPFRPVLVSGIEQQPGEAFFNRQVRVRAEFCIADTSCFLEPDEITRRRPGRLREPGRTADYWIVTPREFVPAANRLAAYRTGNIGWLPNARVRVAALEDIYDEYSFGKEEPGAIKAFFADKRPVYGLLAGDATYDYRDHLGRQPPPGVPSWQVGYSLDPSGVSGRETYALDAWYADFEGTGSSPDMILGRLTCRSAAELSAYVDKLIAYETGPTGLWSRRYLLLADDEWSGEPGRPDPLGFRHIEQCEFMAGIPGSSMNPVKVYLTEHQFAGVKNKPGARAELLREFQAGALVFAFFGHGDAFDLCHESVFNISQVPEVTNESRLPFCYFGSCSVGRFDDTRTDCIAEELVRSPAGGAVVAVGASKATASSSNTVFGRNLLRPLFGDPDSTVGVAFFQAWPTDPLYHLFGDPATRLRRACRPADSLAVTPDTLRPGAMFAGRASLGETDGFCEWRLSGPERERTYSSPRGTVRYRLPGLTLARGNARVLSGQVDFEGLFPLGMALDTVFVGDGSYVPLPGSCQASGVAGGHNLVRDSLDWSRIAEASGDSTGPTVRLLVNGRKLFDGAELPSAFEVEGLVEDRSGILVAPVPGWSPAFFTSSNREPVDLSDRFEFDVSRMTTARFRVPVRLSRGEDTLWTVVSDNLLNRTVVAVAVRVHDGTEPFRVDSVRVYPNPVSGRAWFSFEPNRAAVVRIRVFALSGRLVRDLGDRPAVFGYNQFDWDGRDAHGNPLANGVYLFTVTARAAGVEGYETVRLRDRLLVLR